MTERLARWSAGVAAFGIALTLTLWALPRPALWLDESASAVATDRSWAGVWRLWGGTDAPLVPYYLVLKALRVASCALVPPAAQHPEVLLRWPSAVAIAVAAGLLVTWLYRVGSCALALTGGTVLLTLAGVSRYGQEARPYALTLLLAVVAALAWHRLMATASNLAILAYALSVAALTSLHSVAVLLIAAHLVATVVIRDELDEMPLRVLALLCGALIGLLIAGPALFTAVTYGGGATRYRSLTPESFLTSVATLFGGSRPTGRFLVFAALAGLGLRQWSSPRYADLTRLAACWALVPPLLYVPLVVARPNLLVGRYLLFIVPGWAILAGLGILSAAQGLARLADGSRLGALLRAGALTSVLTLIILMQWPRLVAVRTPDAHGFDVRPTVTALRDPAYESLPVVVSTSTDMLQIAAYWPNVVHRVPNQAMNPVNVWPDRVHAPNLLRGATNALLVARPTHCGRMPVYLNGFRITTNPGPALTLLRRRAGPLPPRGFRYSAPLVPPRLTLPCYSVPSAG